ncbi:MAG: HD domain-containing protein [Nanoarchaeota archaeon]
MEDIYLKLWDLAKPYYLNGRSYDIAHVEWMMREAEIISDIESLDRRLLLPIVILHDVGYSIINDKNPNIKGKETKRVHMREGARISRILLDSVGYEQQLEKRIVHYISVHDNWLFGDDTPFKECKEMAVFNDLDFLWVNADINIFKKMAASMGLVPGEFYNLWVNDEKLTRRPFCCDYTIRVWETSIRQIKQVLDASSQ